MAYTELQKRDCAREIARAGGNLAAACRALREQYESFDKIGETTLRRMLRAAGFPELIAAEGVKLGDAREAAIRSAEARRAQQEMEAAILEPLKRDESILQRARDLLEEKLRSDKPDSISEAVKAFAAINKIIEARQERAVPVMASVQEGTFLVESVAEVLQAKLDPGRRQDIVDAIRERYIEKLKAADAAKGSAAVAEAAT